MSTFVLVLIVSMSYRAGVTNVPGYESREACEAAAREIAQATSASDRARAYCIQGPSR
jgi:hypothetical protein